MYAHTQSTGVLVIVMIVFNCLCCGSFVGLCCGLSLNNCCKVFLVTGFILFTLMLLIFMVWVGGGKSHIMYEFSVIEVPI